MFLTFFIIDIYVVVDIVENGENGDDSKQQEVEGTSGWRL